MTSIRTAGRRVDDQLVTEVVRAARFEVADDGSRTQPGELGVRRRHRSTTAVSLRFLAERYGISKDTVARILAERSVEPSRVKRIGSRAPRQGVRGKDPIIAVHDVIGLRRHGVETIVAFSAAVPLRAEDSKRFDFRNNGNVPLWQVMRTLSQRSTEVEVPDAGLDTWLAECRSVLPQSCGLLVVAGNLGADSVRTLSKVSERSPHRVCAELCGSANAWVSTTERYLGQLHHRLLTEGVLWSGSPFDQALRRWLEPQESHARCWSPLSSPQRQRPRRPVGNRGTRYGSDVRSAVMVRLSVPLGLGETAHQRHRALSDEFGPSVETIRLWAKSAESKG